MREVVDSRSGRAVHSHSRANAVFRGQAHLIDLIGAETLLDLGIVLRLRMLHASTGV